MTLLYLVYVTVLSYEDCVRFYTCVNVNVCLLLDIMAESLECAVVTSSTPSLINWALCFVCGKKEPKSVTLTKPFARRG